MEEVLLARSPCELRSTIDAPDLDVYVIRRFTGAWLGVIESAIGFVIGHSG